VRSRTRRRRAVALLALALASGGLAASQVQSSVREVEARVGPSLPVVVAREDLRAGTRLAPGGLDHALAVRDVPEEFVPPDSLATLEEALGLRVAVPIAAGSYVTLGHLEAGAPTGESGPLLAPGERVVQIAVAGGDALAAAGPGARVDVLITTGAETDTGRTYLALESVELLDLRSGGDAGSATAPGAAAGGTLASLRVTLEQAVMLTAAQNFAQEIRLLARSPEDRRRVGRTSVEASDL
jgi:pilus assembly protein CpaB